LNIRTNVTLNKTDLADLLAMQISGLRLPRGVREYEGAIPGRRFRLDLAWPTLKMCCEVDGGDRMQGRHNRAQGMAADCEKANLLTLAGWKVFRFTGSQVKSGAAIAFLERVFLEHHNL
jgi:very-short-patch-repair endonuclease